MKLRNKKLSTLLFSALIVLVFFGCQSMDEAMMRLSLNTAQRNLISRATITVHGIMMVQG